MSKPCPHSVLPRYPEVSTVRGRVEPLGTITTWIVPVHVLPALGESNRIGWSIGINGDRSGLDSNPPPRDPKKGDVTTWFASERDVRDGVGNLRSSLD
eukprot:scaffold25_cov342-Pavlova_lutheri.AAC.76